MTRNHLLIQSMEPHRPAGPSVWRMTMALLGYAFGAPRQERPR